MNDVYFPSQNSELYIIDLTSDNAFILIDLKQIFI